MLTDRRNNLISLAARNSLKKPTSTIPVASIMLPATVMKSNVFHASLKYGCTKMMKMNVYSKVALFSAPVLKRAEYCDNTIYFLLPLAQMKKF